MLCELEEEGKVQSPIAYDSDISYSAYISRVQNFAKSRENSKHTRVGAGPAPASMGGHTKYAAVAQAFTRANSRGCSNRA